MKRHSVFLMAIIFICLISSLSQATEQTEQAWYEKFPLDSIYHYTSITLDTSYAWGEGSMYDFTVQNQLPEGFNINYLVELDLEGYFEDNYVNTYLFYPSLGEKELTLHFESPTWTLDYDTMDLKLPQLKTSFARQQIKGWRGQYADREKYLQLFLGTKTYQTKSFTTTIEDENQFKYDIFNGPDGDMVEYSEAVFLQGERLQRYIDYKVNYIDGNITLLTSIRKGSVIEVKYNYIPQGKEVRDRVGGSYYQYYYGRSSASVFYLHEMEEETVMVPEKEGSLVLVEGLEENHTNYLGTAFNVVQERVNLTGEMAWTRPQDDDQEAIDYGGQIDFSYNPTPQLALQYQLTTATEGYQGVGPVAITAGEKQELSGAYQLGSKWNIELDLTQIRKDKKVEKARPIILLPQAVPTETVETRQRISEATIGYQVHPRHQLSLSVYNSTMEEGETTAATTQDYLSGWKYQINDDLILSLENSLNDPTRYELNLEMDTYQLRFNSEYKQYDQKEKADQPPTWWRESNTDLSYRPINGVTLTADVDYLQNFESTFEDSKRRLAFMALATPNKKFSTRSNYVYFYNPTTANRTIFYDTNTTVILPYDLQWDVMVDHIQIDSEKVANTTEKWSTGFQIPLFQRLTPSYEISKRYKKEYLIISDRINQGDNTLSHSYGLGYLLTDLLTLQFNYTESEANNVTNTYEVVDATDEIAFSINYLDENATFEYSLGYLKNSVTDLFGSQLKTDQLHQKIDWKNSWHNFSYNYQGDITYSQLNNQITNHQESFTAEWASDTSRFQPSVELLHINVHAPEQIWLKRKAAGKLTYKISDDKRIFTEVGNVFLFYEKQPVTVEKNKNYYAYYLRTGVEYSF